MTYSDERPEMIDVDADGSSAPPKEHWHVGREIPIALIFVVLIQTAGGVWWASTMTSKIDSALVTLSEFRAERYTKEDGRRDREFLGLVLEGLKTRDGELERRLGLMERQHEMVLNFRTFHNGETNRFPR